jgi:hypothetical protein
VDFKFQKRNELKIGNIYTIPFLVIPVKTGIQEKLEITGYTLKGTIAGLRRYDKIDAWTFCYYVKFRLLVELSPKHSGAG